MHATRFEYRHQALLHLLLVGIATLTYLFIPDDIVWAMVRHHAHPAPLERLAFGLGTLMLLASAMLETWATAHASFRLVQRPLSWARLLLALAIGLLLPAVGTLILLTGEVLLVSRLNLQPTIKPTPSQPQPSSQRSHWILAFRKAASKWGLTASMFVFTLTLQDRIAEIGAALSFLLWAALNRKTLLKPVP